MVFLRGTFVVSCVVLDGGSVVVAGGAWVTPGF
jgi:hypothetical protein